MRRDAAASVAAHGGSIDHPKGIAELKGARPRHNANLLQQALQLQPMGIGNELTHHACLQWKACMLAQKAPAPIQHSLFVRLPIDLDDKAIVLQDRLLPYRLHDDAQGEQRQCLNRWRRARQPPYPSNGAPSNGSPSNGSMPITWFRAHPWSGASDQVVMRGNQGSDGKPTGREKETPEAQENNPQRFGGDHQAVDHW